MNEDLEELKKSCSDFNLSLFKMVERHPQEFWILVEYSRMVDNLSNIVEGIVLNRQ